MAEARSENALLLRLGAKRKSERSRARVFDVEFAFSNFLWNSGHCMNSTQEFSEFPSYRSGSGSMRMKFPSRFLV